jgi:hypothetical protein
MVAIFMIVGRNEPLYEVDFESTSTSAASNTTTAPTPQATTASSNLFVLYSSLDMLESSMWTQHGT